MSDSAGANSISGQWEQRKAQLLQQLQQIQAEQESAQAAQDELAQEAVGLEEDSQRLAREEAELQRRKQELHQRSLDLGARRQAAMERLQRAGQERNRVEDAMQEALRSLQQARAYEAHQAQQAHQAQEAQEVQEAQVQPSAEKKLPELDPANRRKIPRASLAVDVSMQSDNNFFMGLTENLSEGGLFIATYNILPEGSIVEVDLRLPTHPPIQTQAKVSWVREENQFTKDVAPGVGVQFLDLTENDQQAIRRFIQQRDPILYDLG